MANIEMDTLKSVPTLFTSSVLTSLSTPLSHSLLCLLPQSSPEHITPCNIQDSISIALNL